MGPRSTSAGVPVRRRMQHVRMQVDASTTPMPLASAAADCRRLVELTRVGAPVAPVIDTLDHAVQALKGAREALGQARASAATLAVVDRVEGGAATLRNALAELRDNDGMVTFDAAFAGDDRSWDANLTAWADALDSAH